MDPPVVIRHGGVEHTFQAGELSESQLCAAFEVPPAATIQLEDDVSGDIVACSDLTAGQSVSLVVKRSKRVRGVREASRIGTIVASADDDLEEVFGFHSGDAASSRPDSLGLLREFEVALAKLHEETNRTPCTHKRVVRRRSQSTGQLEGPGSPASLLRQRSQSHGESMDLVGRTSSSPDAAAKSDGRPQSPQEQLYGSQVLVEEEADTSGSSADEAEEGLETTFDDEDEPREVMVPCDAVKDKKQFRIRCDRVKHLPPLLGFERHHSAIPSPSRGSLNSELFPSSSLPASPTSSRRDTLEVEHLTPVLVVDHVQPGSAVEQAGVREGDYLLEVNGDYVMSSSKEYVEKLFAAATGPLILRVRSPNSTATPEPQRSASSRKLANFFGESLPGHAVLPSEVVKEGTLIRKLLVTGGKKSKKRHRHWKSFTCTLRGHVLQFADEEDGDDFDTVSVKHCICDIAYDYTKKKNVFRFTAFNGTEFLLQASSREDMLGWIKAIQENNNPDNDEDGYDLIKRKASDALLSHAMKTSGTPKTAVPRGSGSTPRLFSRLSNSALLHFGRKRSTDQSAVPNLFELGLNDMCDRFGTDIPVVIQRCVEEVEARGLDTEGLYRLGGATSQTKMVKEAFVRGAMNIDLSQCDDINVVSGILKGYIRNLADPLLTAHLYPEFITASRDETGNARLLKLRDLVRKLPEVNYRTLRFIVSHLRTVASHSEENKMECRNLSIVFGPTMVRPLGDDVASMVSDMSQQCAVVASFVENFDVIFGGDDVALPDMDGPGRSMVENVLKPAQLLGEKFSTGQSKTNLLLSPVAEERLSLLLEPSTLGGQSSTDPDLADVDEEGEGYDDEARFVHSLLQGSMFAPGGEDDNDTDGGEENLEYEPVPPAASSDDDDDGNEYRTGHVDDDVRGFGDEQAELDHAHEDADGGNQRDGGSGRYLLTAPRSGVRVVDLGSPVDDEFGFVPSKQGFAAAFAAMDEDDDRSVATGAETEEEYLARVRKAVEEEVVSGFGSDEDADADATDPPIELGTPPSTPLPAIPTEHQQRRQDPPPQPIADGEMAHQRTKSLLARFEQLVDDIDASRHSKGSTRTVRASSFSSPRGSGSSSRKGSGVVRSGDDEEVNLRLLAERENPSPHVVRAALAKQKQGSGLLYQEVEDDLPKGLRNARSCEDLSSGGSHSLRPNAFEQRHTSDQSDSSQTSGRPTPARRARERKMSGSLAHALKHVPGPETVI